MSALFAHTVKALGGGLLKFNTGTGAPVGAHVSQGLLIDAAGAIFASTSEPVARVHAGVPFTADGRVCIATTGSVDRIAPGGLPFTSAGRLLISGVRTHEMNGLYYASTGAYASA